LAKIGRVDIAAVEELAAAARRLTLDPVDELDRVIEDDIDIALLQGGLCGFFGGERHYFAVGVIALEPRLMRRAALHADAAAGEALRTGRGERASIARGEMPERAIEGACRLGIGERLRPEPKCGDHDIGLIAGECRQQFGERRHARFAAHAQFRTHGIGNLDIEADEAVIVIAIVERREAVIDQHPDRATDRLRRRRLGIDGAKQRHRIVRHRRLRRSKLCCSEHRHCHERWEILPHDRLGSTFRCSGWQIRVAV